MQGRNFVLTFFVSFFLLTAALSLFNYSIDAACLYSRIQVVERVINDLLAGKIIAGQPAFQYRYFQKLIIEKRKEIPDTIAIGSSRSMTVRSSYLGIDQDSFFNHSVPCAVLNDYIAILGCYKKKGAFPKTIILGIDPFVFDKKTGRSKKWRPLLSGYYYLLNIIRGNTSQLKLFYEMVNDKVLKAKRLLSYNYTITNYEYIKYIREQGFDYKAVKDTTVDNWLIAPDGSLYRLFILRYQDDPTTQKKVQRALNKGTEIDRYRQISFQELFIRLIDYLLDDGMQIVFFLPPYHPRMYQEFAKKETCIVLKIEEMLRSLAQSRNIPVFGSYDPGCFNLSSRDFFDAVHVRDYVVKEIFKGYGKVVTE